MGADRTSSLGADQIVRTLEEARCKVEQPPARYDGPCAQTYAHVLNAYVSAPEWGRAALVLKMACRAVGATAATSRPVAPNADQASGLQVAHWPPALLVRPTSTGGR